MRASHHVHRFRRFHRLLLPLLLGWAAGCATTGREGAGRIALRAVPPVPESQLRADRAILAAFFAASGAPISGAQLDKIIPPAAPAGRLDRNALRTVAGTRGRVLTVVKADETFLWEALGDNLPLLVFLPPDRHYHPTAAAVIPVAWDAAAGTLDLLDGNGILQTLSADEFFARREPLKHAALCLLKPGALIRLQPTREQKLVLADFWFDQGFYRRANAVYTSIQKESPDGIGDVEVLIGKGNVLVLKGRYAEASDFFRAALLRAPDDPRILNNLAYSMLHGGGELLVALRHASKAEQLDPENPVVLETVGSIHLRLGDAPTAAKYLERAWARSLKRPPEIQIAIMDQLVRAWLAANRRDLAWQVAEYRHRAFPNYRIPKDILKIFSDLRKPAEPLPEKK